MAPANNSGYHTRREPGLTAHAWLRILFAYVTVAVLSARVPEQARGEEPRQLSKAVRQLHDMGVGQDVRGAFEASLPHAQVTVTSYSTTPSEKGKLTVKSRYDGRVFYCVVNADSTLRYFTAVRKDDILELIRQEGSGRDRLYVHLAAKLGHKNEVVGYTAYAGTKTSPCSVSINVSRRVWLKYDDVTSIFDVADDGSQAEIEWYSDRQVREVRRAAWMELYLNPVGWYAALVKGTRPDTLYILKRSEGWKRALAVGWVIGPVLAVVAILAVVKLLRRMCKRVWGQEIDT